MAEQSTSGSESAAVATRGEAKRPDTPLSSERGNTTVIVRRGEGEGADIGNW